MIIVLIFIVAVVAGVVIMLKMDKKKTNILEKLYPGYEIQTSMKDTICFGKEDIVFVPSMCTKEVETHLKVKNIDDIEVYEDGKSKSAGKALVGGITFGLLGAVVGASMKTEYVTSLGLRVYANGKVFDLPELYSKTKRDSATYRLSIDHFNRIRAKLLPYQK